MCLKTRMCKMKSIFSCIFKADTPGYQFEIFSPKRMVRVPVQTARSGKQRNVASNAKVMNGRNSASASAHPKSTHKNEDPLYLGYRTRLGKAPSPLRGDFAKKSNGSVVPQPAEPTMLIKSVLPQDNSRNMKNVDAGTPFHGTFVAKAGGVTVVGAATGMLTVKKKRRPREASVRATQTSA